MLDILKVRNNAITILLQIMFVYCFYMVSVKRLHDLNMSAVLVLISGMAPYIPTIIYYKEGGSEYLPKLSAILYIIWGLYLLFSLFFCKGTEGANKYGDAPTMPIKFLQKIKDTKNLEKTTLKDETGDTGMIFRKRDSKEQFDLYTYSKSYYKLPYLCILDFIRIVNESQDKNDDFLRGFASGYILGSKDIMSQSYFMSGNKDVAQAVADIPILVIMQELIQNARIFQPDIAAIEALKVIQTGMIHDGRKYPEPEMSMLTTITFIEYVSQMHKNNSFRGLIYGYIISAKDMITYDPQGDINEKNRIANIEVEKVCQFVIDKFNKYKEEYAQEIVHPFVLDAIYKL